MHTIKINKPVKEGLIKLLIASASREMKVNLPNRILLVVPDVEREYIISSYNASGVVEAPASN